MTPEEYEAEILKLRDTIQAMTNWLQKYQPDVFMRGLLYEMGRAGNATTQGETPSTPGERCEPGASDGDSACPSALPSSANDGEGKP